MSEFINKQVERNFRPENMYNSWVEVDKYLDSTECVSVRVLAVSVE